VMLWQWMGGFQQFKGTYSTHSSDFSRGRCSGNFSADYWHDYLAPDVYKSLIYPSPVHVLCKAGNSMMNQDHCTNCTVLGPGNMS
jgi:hypothetical protein